MTTVYLENNDDQLRNNKISILYDAYDKRFIKLASIQINKIIAMLKRQFKYDYTVNIVSHLEHTNFPFIDKSSTTSEYQTTTDGFISSGRVFYYQCKEEDTKEERNRKLSRVSIDSIRLNIREKCIYNIEPLYHFIMNEKELKCKIFKVSSVNDNLFDSKEEFDVITKKDKSSDEKKLIDDVCIIEFDENFKSRFTGITNMNKNKNYDKESLDCLEELQIFHKDDFTKALESIK